MTYLYKYKDTISVIETPDPDPGDPEETMKPTNVPSCCVYVQYDVPEGVCYLYSNTVIPGLELVDTNVEAEPSIWG